jgi:hypothetical protein
VVARALPCNDKCKNIWGKKIGGRESRVEARERRWSKRIYSIGASILTYYHTSCRGVEPASLAGNDCRFNILPLGRFGFRTGSMHARRWFQIPGRCVMCSSNARWPIVMTSDLVSVICCFLIWLTPFFHLRRANGHPDFFAWATAPPKTVQTAYRRQNVTDSLIINLILEKEKKNSENR